MMKKIIIAAMMILCAVYLKAQTVTPKSTLKNWFITGAKPTQAQFWAWMDSYYHKDDSIPAAKVSGLPSFIPQYFTQLKDVNVATGLHDMQTIVWDSAQGKWINSYTNCVIDFSDIEGNANDNSSLNTILLTKQNLLKQQDLLDTYPYYYDGHTNLTRFDSGVRKYAGINSIDSSNGGFLTFSDSNNLMLNHAGAMVNIDTFPSWGGFYRYSPSTRGTRPSAGGLGVVMNIVAQDLKVSPLGAGRVYQMAMDGSINKSFLRYYNGSWSAWDTIYTSTYHPGLGGGGGSATFEDVLNNQGATAMTGNHTVDFGDKNIYLTNGKFLISSNALSETTTPSAYISFANATTYYPDLAAIALPITDGYTHNKIAGGDNHIQSGFDFTSGGRLSFFRISDTAGSRYDAFFPTDRYKSNYPNNDTLATLSDIKNATYFKSNVTFNGDILTSTDQTYDIGTSSNRFSNAFINTLQGLNLNVQTIGLGQNLKLRNGTQSGLTILGTSSFLQINQTPATNSETTPQVLVRNATTGNVEQVASTSLPARVTAVFIGNQNTATVAASTTTYGIVSGQAGTGILTAKSIMIGQAGTLKNAYLMTGSTQDASGSLVCTLYKNGSATSIVITIAAGSGAGTYSDTTHTVTMSAGDTLAWQYVNNATATSAILGNTSLTLSN